VPNVTIRRAQPHEAGDLRQLVIRSMGHWEHSADYLAQAAELMDLSADELERDDAWVAEVDDAAIGFCRLSRSGDTAEIEELHLEPAWIGRGIGRTLFEHAARHAHRTGTRWLVWSTDRNALGFYLAMGGVVTGSTPSGVTGDAPLVTMRLDLDA
jgi:GNAT superfamily N-acetyltransferase